MTTVSALLYYNLNGIPYEAENLEAFTYNLNRLRELSAQVGDAVLAEQVRLLGDAVNCLKLISPNPCSHSNANYCGANRIR